jgi:NADH:ubiquinone oxidoreductase subunit 6 (subunit J)
VIKDNTIIWAFYLIALAISVSSGFFFGFSNSHIPPVPFLLGAVFVFIGLVWILFEVVLSIARDTKKYNVFIVHLAGLAINILFLVSLWIHGTKSL